MATYALPSDVATRLGLGGSGFDEDEESQALALLEDVSAVMRSRLPLLDTWITAGLVGADTAKAVACWLAMECITVATTGVGKSGETHPEHAVTIRSAAGLDLSDAQVAQLTPAGARGSGRPFSIRPGGD
ncbi:hypothetical protein GCM10022243_48200 [Saccharothrix violaceirubra]|uniref:Gp19/Gp15/Gp42-like protein n=1 Tax=Saccharothrix violaceirubra TaxID=413306 RepID=A0A7W7SZI4_9PSEU|nr:hypothetical protein [Saccharothrix violaceirubra]MBB4963838.1 hypothetical protein [Saccharothrix violaceirubra]